MAYKTSPTAGSDIRTDYALIATTLGAAFLALIYLILI
jgi:hypothetical protein